MTIRTGSITATIHEPVDLEALNALINEATDEPWATDDDAQVWSSHPTDPVARATRMEDARLIAAARTALPAPVAELQAARAEIERLRAVCDELAAESVEQASATANPVGLDAMYKIDFGRPAVHSDRPPMVTGLCGHAVALSDWRTGSRVCEQCPKVESPIAELLPKIRP